MRGSFLRSGLEILCIGLRKSERSIYLHRWRLGSSILFSEVYRIFSCDIKLLCFWLPWSVGLGRAILSSRKYFYDGGIISLWDGLFFCILSCSYSSISSLLISSLPILCGWRRENDLNQGSRICLNENKRKEE